MFNQLRCPMCDGQGGWLSHTALARMVECETCDGTGEIDAELYDQLAGDAEADRGDEIRKYGN